MVGYVPGSLLLRNLTIAALGTFDNLKRILREQGASPLYPQWRSFLPELAGNRDSGLRRLLPTLRYGRNGYAPLSLLPRLEN